MEIREQPLVSSMGYARPNMVLFVLACALSFVGSAVGQLDGVVKVKWSASDYSVVEDAGELSVSLSATGLAGLNCSGTVVVTIGLAPIPFSATPFDIATGGSGGDFVLDVETFSNSPVEVTFLPGGEVSTAHTIELVGDNAYEGEESFYLDIMNISTPDSCVSKIKISSQFRVQVQLVDNDVINVNFTQRQINVCEGEKAVIVAGLYGSPFQEVLEIGIICFKPRSGGRLNPATAREDYTLGKDAALVFDTVTVQPPVSSNEVMIKIKDDDIAEETESFICALRLTVNPSDPLQAIEPDTVTISIKDKNVEVRWSASEYSVLEDAGDLSVSLSATSLADLNCGGPVVVTIGLAPIPFSAMPFDISNGGSDGDFVLDVETFSNSPVQVTFLPGEEVSTAHTIDLVGDNVYEGEESFYLDIMNISAPASCVSKIKISSQSRVQVLLVDNDVINVNFTQRQIKVDEDEGKAVIKGRLYGSPFQEVLEIGIICFEPRSGGRLNPASVGKDFVSREGKQLLFDTVTVQPPVSSSEFKIRIIDDDIAEETESFICALRLTVNPSDPLQAIEPDTVTISICDDDQLSISWVKPLYFVSESDRLALVSLNASNQFTLNFTVSGQPEEVDNGEDHIVLNGTRYSLARRTEDFVPVGCLAFEFSTVFGSLVSTNSFRLKDDNVLEEDEVFKGTYEIPSIIARQLSVTAVEPKVTYVVIQDDDTVRAEFVNTNYSVSESGGSVDVSIVLRGLHSIPLEVTVECVEDDPVSAEDDKDFVSITSIITFPTNLVDTSTMSAPISITIRPDDILEGTERLICRIIDPSHPRIMLGPPATVHIMDDDRLGLR